MIGKQLLFGILACFTARTVAIIHGDVAHARQFPYQISILLRGYHHNCGGGIINHLFVITAAHCVITDGIHIDKSSNMSVLAGTNDLTNTDLPAVIIPVKRVFVPAEYKRSVASKGDIAVLKLVRSLGLDNNFEALKLPHNEDESYIGKSAIISGWGWDWYKIEEGQERGGNTDSFLRFAEVDVIDTPEKLKRRISEKQICAKIKQYNHAKPRGICNGDSGSPLVHDGTIIGILSIGPRGCSEVEKPAVYTRITKYLNFIHHAIHDKHPPDADVAEFHH